MRRRLPVLPPLLLALLLAPGPAAGTSPDERDAARIAPSVRVHWPADAGLPDHDGDGRPDAVAALLDLAGRVDRECRAAGIGPLPEDEDGELDLLLGRARGPGNGLRLPLREALRDPAEFQAEAARRLALAVLAARAPGAPSWWTAPTACWIAREASGLLPRACGTPALRWTHPEPGLLTADPLLAPGNLALLDALGRRRVARAVLAATWRHLAGDDLATPVEAVDAGLRETIGTDLPGLLLRAGVLRIAAGEVPPREAARVRSLPVLGEPLDFPVAPLGGALVRVEPDPRFPSATVLELEPEQGAFRATLLARRASGPFDRVDLAPGPDGVLRVPIPWHDYGEAFVLLVRGAGEAGAAEVELRAEPGDDEPPFELASLAATASPGGTVMLEWRTSREDGIAGWLVERETADGEWTTVTPVLLPALGSLTGGGTYLVPDATAPAGPARWRPVAVLSTGLRWTGPVVSLRP